MIEHYELTAEEAGKRCGVSRTTFIKFSNLYSDELPRLEIKPGKKAVIRFCEKHVHAFVRKRLANISEATNPWAEKLYDRLLMDISVAANKISGDKTVFDPVFHLQFDMLMNVFLDIDHQASSDDVKLRLLDMLPHLSTELEPHVGDEAAALALHAINKALEYLMEWQVVEFTQEQGLAIYKAVYSYKTNFA